MRAWHGLFLLGSSARVQDDHFPKGNTMASCLAFHDFTAQLGLEAALFLVALLCSLFPVVFQQSHIATRDRQFPPIPQGTSPADSSLEQFPTGMLLGKRQEHS